MPKGKRPDISDAASRFISKNQPANTPESQNTSTPVEPPQDEEKANFKVTYYITEELDLKLEQIRLARRKRGIKVDKSQLIREAIRLLQE